MEKPTLPKGTRDFGPAIMAKRQFIFENIKNVFQMFGFQPLETPAMENLSTLTGKYGEEGDQLLFKVFDSGAPFAKIPEYVEERHKFMRGLQLVLKNLCLLVFSELDERATRNWAKIQEIIESDAVERLFIGIHLDTFQRSILKDFIRRESVVTSINLVEFFTNASIHKNEEYREKIDFHFSQFVDNKLIKGYSKILEAYILENLEPRLKEYAVSKITSKELTNFLSEKGLRYDLTVPFARFVVMNRNEITFPFKRYQIQPVWRADRPQKGRYREFYQCDADVVGTTSLICEAEIILMIKNVFKGLGITDYTIKINHRGILSGLAEVIDAKGNETSLFVAIDKLDKIGEEKVKEELRTKGFSEKSLTALFEILNVKGSTVNKMAFLSSRFDQSAEGKKGLHDLEEVFELLNSYGANPDHVEFDVALARGLSYYTGCIFEVKINNVSIGSVSGGGRYDNLTAAFGDKENLSGVGFSFGVDRIYDAMEELNLFSKETRISSKVIICHFDDETMHYGLGVLTKLREAGIPSEIYPDLSKLKKQLEYANKKSIPYTLVIGSEEVKSGRLALKNMETGNQEMLSVDEIVATLNK